MNVSEELAFFVCKVEKSATLKTGESVGSPKTWLHIPEDR